MKLADLVNTSYKDLAATRQPALPFLIRPSIIVPSGKPLTIGSIRFASPVIGF